MKNLLRLILPLIICGTAGAADVSVRVMDPHQDPIPAATVSLISRDGERRTLTTDSSGACRFTALAAGEYFVQGDAAGFDASQPRLVELKSDSNVDVTLPLGLPEVKSSVVVTASGTPQSTDEVSKALTVIDSDTMTLRTDQSVGDALVDVPGLRVQQLGGPLSQMYFQIRGLRDTDTAVLVDGLRLRDAAGTQADASDVLQDLVLTDTSRIEVLRGSGSSLYGTDATGGVVNIVTDQGGGRTRGSIGVDGGALGAIRGTTHLAGGFLNDRIQYSLGVTHWNVTSGIGGNNPAHITSEQGQVTFRLSRIAWISARIYAGQSRSFVTLEPQAVGNLPSSGIIDAVPVSVSQQRLYEAGAQLSDLALGSVTFLPDVHDPDSTLAATFFTGAFRFTLRPSDKFGFTAVYQDVSAKRNYGDGPAGPGDQQPTGTNLSNYLGRIQTVDARMDASVGRFQHIDVGYEFENEDFQNRLLPPPPTTDFFSDVSQRSNAIYAQDQVHLMDGRLQFAVGYRAQFFSLNAPEFQPVAGAPFAGMTFAAPPTAQTGDASAAYTLWRSSTQRSTKIRAHAGRGYRAPSLFERFGTFFDGMNYTLFGDPRLRPDRLSAIDGGVDQRLWNSRVQLSATYFYTRLNSVIIFDTSGAINSLTDPFGRNGGYRNTGGGLARGVEFSSAIAATRSLQLTGAFTYTDAREETPIVPGVWQSFEDPREQYSAFATERFSSRLTGVFGYVGSTSYLANVSGLGFRFGGPSRAQVALSYRYPLSEFRALRFYFKGDNLFNQTYFQDGFRAPGATFTGGTQFEF
jgi:vitamin B12 transporter